MTCAIGVLSDCRLFLLHINKQVLPQLKALLCQAKHKAVPCTSIEQCTFSQLQRFMQHKYAWATWQYRTCVEAERE